MEEKKYSELTQEEREKKISQLEARIADLEQHRSMWFRAGGMGGRMASQANSEIEELRLKIDDLKRGTHHFERLELEKQISLLKLESEDYVLFKKKKKKRAIKLKKNRLEELKKIDNEIELSSVVSNKKKK